MGLEDSVKRYEELAELFEAGEYDTAVAGFVEMYQKGEMREQILEALYSCFISPNEDEFRANYELNTQTQTCVLPYEQLVIDFVPVTEEKYYLYDKEAQTFLGYIDLQQLYETSEERTFDSLCIAEQWDLRQVATVCNSKYWNQIYMILENQEARFLSFWKLPGIREYLQKLLLFSTLEDMEHFLQRSTEAYLPKQFYAENPDRYQAAMEQLHEARLRNLTQKSSRIFLSICVPSYNRGSIVTQTVRHLLELDYDYEIEIVVSNNGSTQDTEGYEELKKLPDSRLKYFEFEEGQGYASNIRKILELAQGAYAITTSDEDMMELEQFPHFLEYVIQHQDAGIIFTGGIGRNFMSGPEQLAPKGSEALTAALNSNYLTGITYNMTYVHHNQVLQRFDARRGNLFLEYYAHCVLAVMTAENAEVRYSGIPLWNAEIIEAYQEKQQKETSSEQEESKVLEYGTIESRIEQQNTAIEFLLQELCIDMEAMLLLIVDRLMKTYYLLGMVYASHYDSLSQKYRWIDICMIVHRNNRALVDTSLLWFKQNAPDAIIPLIDSIFLGYYKDNPAKGSIPRQNAIQEEMLCLLLEYRHQKGQPLEDMDIMEFTEEIQNLLK